LSHICGCLREIEEVYEAISSLKADADRGWWYEVTEDLGSLWSAIKALEACSGKTLDGVRRIVRRRLERGISQRDELAIEEACERLRKAVLRDLCR
jgi:hypothetical protein